VVKLITNGTIYTLENEKEKVQSVVVNDGKIIDQGSYQDMKLQYGAKIDEIIDLQGKTAIPGLTDSHMHLSGVASQFMELNLTGVRSKDEMLTMIKEKAQTVKPGEWLVGRGWDEHLFADGKIPTMAELDHVAPHCPLFLTRICSHAFLVNRKAFEVCCVHSFSEVPHGGKIVLDPTTNEPTGLILETASQLFTKHIPKKSYEQLKEALRQAIKYCMKCGLTSIHTNDPLYLGGFEQTYRLFAELIHEEGLGLRCNLLIDYPFLPILKEKKITTGYGDSKLQIGAIKMFADGALGRRTALLSQPYEDESGHYGNAIHSQQELYEMIKEVRECSMPVAIHTIGDQALENVLNILDQFPSVHYRDRLIHVSILRQDLLKRLIHPNRVCDIQPRFIVSDFPWIMNRIGEKRVHYAYPFQKMLSLGVLCAGGSDAPIEPVNPLLGIHAAVTRRLIRETHEGYISSEKLSIEEAVRLFTIGGAYATNEEHVKGTVTRGKYADLTVFSHDLMELDDPDALLEANVEMTIIGGKIMYQSES
jgi:hypothetical protein